jgi:hypothetical protein
LILNLSFASRQRFCALEAIGVVPETMRRMPQPTRAADAELRPRRRNGLDFARTLRAAQGNSAIWWRFSRKTRSASSLRRVFRSQMTTPVL